MLGIYRALVATLMAILTTTLVAQAQVPTRAVALDGDPAPGGGTFDIPASDPTFPRIPAIAGDTIVFDTYIRESDGEVSLALVAETDGALRIVARYGESLLGGVLYSLHNYAPDRLGNVFVTAALGELPQFDAVVEFPAEGSPVRLVSIGDATSNGVVTGFPGSVVAADGTGGAFVRAVFHDDYRDSAILHATAYGTIDVIAASGQPAPGGGVFGPIYAPIASSPLGGVLFAAGTGGEDAAYFELTPAGLVRLAKRDTVNALSGIFGLSVDETGRAAVTDGPTGSIELATESEVIRLVDWRAAYAPRIGADAELYAFSTSSSYAAGRVFVVSTFLQRNAPRGTALFRRDTDGSFDAILAPYDVAAARTGSVFLSFATGNLNLTAQMANEDGDVVFRAATMSAGEGVFTTRAAVDPAGPAISSVGVVDGRLVVVGERFARGARIVVGTRRFKNTKRDKQNPTTRLTSKTADGALDPNLTTSVSVVNPDGRQSAAFGVGPGF